jgi:hypothetical protein
MTTSPDSFTAPSANIDVADWLGIEVVPNQPTDPVPCTTRIRQLGRGGPWMSRDGTAQELRLFRAIVALVRSSPVEGRDLVLDLAELTRVLQYTPAAPIEVYRSITQRVETAEGYRRQRDDARMTARASNEDLVAVVAGFRGLRASAEHQRNSPAFHRQEGELNALDYVIRLLSGEEALTDPR